MTHQTVEAPANGPFSDLIELFVEDGMLAAGLEANPARREGIQDGLEMCLAMKDLEVAELEGVLISMQEAGHDIHDQMGAHEASHDDCQRHVAATKQLARCFEILTVAHFVEYDEFYGGVLRYRFGEWRLEPDYPTPHAVESHGDLVVRALSRED